MPVNLRKQIDQPSHRRISKKKINILINSKDLVLKTDLLIGEKLLDEGKQLGLIGKVRAVRQ